ncbi:MAG: type II toxin-antitoxin system VapC family toxin [Terriglobia bacterium]
MIYLDASALVKRYVQEPGSEAIDLRFARAERIHTSLLSYAEVLAALGRKYHRGELQSSAFRRARDKFLRDFVLLLDVLDMDTTTLVALPGLVERYPIRGADAVHLSSALWLRDMVLMVPEFAAGNVAVEFCTSDRRLSEFARDSGLAVVAP